MAIHAVTRKGLASTVTTVALIAHEFIRINQSPVRRDLDERTMLVTLVKIADWVHCDRASVVFLRTVLTHIATAQTALITAFRHLHVLD